MEYQILPNLCLNRPICAMVISSRIFPSWNHGSSPQSLLPPALVLTRKPLANCWVPPTVPLALVYWAGSRQRSVRPPPNYDWLGGFKMLNYHRCLVLFWCPILQLLGIMIFQCWNHPVIGPDVWSGATDFEAGAWQCWPQRHWLHSELWTIFFSVQMEVVPLVQCEGSGSPQIGALRVLQTPWSSWHLTTSRFWCYKELNWFVFGMRRSKLDEMTHGLLPHFFSSCQYFWPIYFGMTP